MQVDRKTLAVLQSIVILNFTSFCTVDQQSFACTFIFGSVHVCTTMKISMHDASRSENIRSISKCYHTKVHIILSNRLALIFLESVHVCTTTKISMHDASRSENIRSTSKCCHTKFHIILSNRLALLCLQIHFWSLCTYARL